MNVDSASDLRRWAADIETALGIILSSTERGAFALRTTGGAMVGIEPAPNVHCLIFTGQIGTADETVGERKLKALLAMNLEVGLTGTGCIGLAPKNDALLMRLIWMPAEAAWSEDAFAAVLTAFAQHVDAMSESLATGAIEAILDISQEPPPKAQSPQFA